MDLLSWAKRRHTPLWLEVAVEPGDAFRVLEAEQPPRVLFTGSTRGRPYIPLMLPLHVEHQDVVQAMYDQVEEILDLAKDCTPTAVVANQTKNDVSSSEEHEAL